MEHFLMEHTSPLLSLEETNLCEANFEGAKLTSRDISYKNI